MYRLPYIQLKIYHRDLNQDDEKKKHSLQPQPIVAALRMPKKFNKDRTISKSNNKSINQTNKS